MLKYPLTILLIMLMALQTFSKWCLLVEFQVNKEYIAKNLCVNRARPACCCHGKCYLNKKMAADESRQQAPGKSGQKEESTWQLLVLDNLLSAPQIPVTQITHSTRHLDSRSAEYPLSFYPPPRA